MTEINRIQLPPLPYSAEDLEPAFGSQTLTVHHGRILRTEVDALNIALDGFPQLRGKSPAELLHRARLPRNAADEIILHAGAVYCHTLYFRSMKAFGGGYPTPRGKISDELRRDIGSYEGFCFEWREAALTMTGPGFVFLVRDQRNGRLSIRSMRDHEVPDPGRYSPVLCMDFWEHAYFREYGADRAAAVNAFLSVINWGEDATPTGN